MTGLLFFALFAAWLYVCIWTSLKIVHAFPLSRWRGIIVPTLIALLAVLPLIDDVLGGYQFQRLCATYASRIDLDQRTAKGRTVYFVRQPPLDLQGALVHVSMRPVKFVDSSTGETVVSYNELDAGGGWLARTLPFSEAHVPLTFRGSCVPANRPASVETFKPYGINYIEPPENTRGRTQ